MDEKQLLRDPGIEITNEIIAQGLGAAYNAYVNTGMTVAETAIRMDVPESYISEQLKGDAV
ncbi:MAG TPA: hypothetical protein DEQ02_04350 [Ruminococcaceae bacterium]|nr:hypothetical protein [Oscillospiraceae bacterium]